MSSESKLRFENDREEKLWTDMFELAMDSLNSPLMSNGVTSAALLADNAVLVLRARMGDRTLVLRDGTEAIMVGAMGEAEKEPEKEPDPDKRVKFNLKFHSDQIMEDRELQDSWLIDHYDWIMPRLIIHRAEPMEDINAALESSNPPQIVKSSMPIGSADSIDTVQLFRKHFEAIVRVAVFSQTWVDKSGQYPVRFTSGLCEQLGRPPTPQDVFSVECLSLDRWLRPMSYGDTFTLISEFRVLVEVYT